MNKTFNRYFGALLFGALLVVSTTSTNLTAFQGDPFGSTAPDPLEKRTTETWQQFMVRMNQAGIVSAAQLQQWQSGKSITVATSVPVTRTRTETRTRTVMVRGDERRRCSSSYPTDSKLHRKRPVHRECFPERHRPCSGFVSWKREV